MVASGHFGIFVSAVHAAGLTEELATKGPFTVFAPTDEAFKKLAAGGYDALVKDAGRLKAILNYHVVSGYFTASDVKSGDLMTLQGTSMSAVVSSPDVRVNGVACLQGRHRCDERHRSRHRRGHSSQELAVAGRRGLTIALSRRTASALQRPRSRGLF